jgi:predicted acylesterase/phospholipase RssA
MSSQASNAVKLAEELLPKLVWLSRDRSPEKERRAGGPPMEGTRPTDVLRPFELLTLALRLKQERAFAYARQILSFLRASQVTEPDLRSYASTRPEPQEDRAWKEAMSIASDPRITQRLAQRHALCTYKDGTLRKRPRLEAALGILREADDLSSTIDQETLGLAGAIHKRLWELDRQKAHLERSLGFYRRGYEAGIETDFGYTAINAAFVLDMLADQEEEEEEAASTDRTPTNEELEAVRARVGALRSEADKIRQEIVSALAERPDHPDDGWLGQKWWFLVTVAEAYFGLGFADKENFEKASHWLGRASGLRDVPDWEFETTARQLATLARLRYPKPHTPEELWKSEPFHFILPFLGKKAAGLRATLAGKVGLSFSGGGFRAALFHVGVLAKLAELDMLRNVEVISCVSAGSIIAALYYLELRELLQRKEDADIKRDDYVAVVERVERAFLDAVQRNVRARLGAELTTGLKTLFHPAYTRTDRLGELLEEMLYSRFAKSQPGGPLMLNELDILPPDEDPASFIPADANWRRAAKVPALVINATTLNTGHNWQFRTGWMGETAAEINPEVDRNPRLRRVRYDNAPEGYRGFPLGRAVAASTATLGLLEPVTLKGIYPGMDVKLVDGIFSDAQAVGPLLEHDCDMLLVSDASGQMHAQERPDTGPLGVALRSGNIMSGVMRGRQHEALEVRRRHSLLRGLMYLHLKKGIDAETYFAGVSEKTVMLDDTRTTNTSELTAYGVLKKVQEYLARIRTDLDAFSDTEAYALMMSGYLMTAHEFQTCVRGYPRPDEPRPRWRFLAIEEPMKTVGHEQMLVLLKAAGRQVSKVVGMSPKLRRAVSLLKFLLVLLPFLLLPFLLGPGAWAFASVVRRVATPPLPTYIALLYAALLLVLAYLFVFVVPQGKTAGQLAVNLFMCTFGWLFSRVTLHLLDPWYLAKGRIPDPPARTDGVSSVQTGEQPSNRLGNLLSSLGTARPIEYLSQRADVTGAVRSIGQLTEHARGVEAVAKLFEHGGYETTRHPRDPRLNPLQLGLDLYAKKGAHRVFTSVRTRGETGGVVDWGAASELSAAISAITSEEGEDEQGIEARLVLVATEADDKLEKFVRKSQKRGLRIEVVTLTEQEAEWCARAQPSDPGLDDAARKLRLEDAPGGDAALPPDAVPAQDAPPLAGGAA